MFHNNPKKILDPCPNRREDIGFPMSTNLKKSRIAQNAQGSSEVHKDQISFIIATLLINFSDLIQRPPISKGDHLFFLGYCEYFSLVNITNTNEILKPHIKHLQSSYRPRVNVKTI